MKWAVTPVRGRRGQRHSISVQYTGITERKSEPVENNTKSGKVQCVPSLDLAQNQVRDGVARLKSTLQRISVIVTAVTVKIAYSDSVFGPKKDLLIMKIIR